MCYAKIITQSWYASKKIVSTTEDQKYIERSLKCRSRQPAKLVVFVLARMMLRIPQKIHFLIKHKCYFQMSLKSHQGSLDTHMLTDAKPHNARGNSRKISSIFLLAALYTRPTADFQWHLCKCQAPFSHPYPQCSKSNFNWVFKLLRKQNSNTPNMFPSRAAIGCYSINHLTHLGNNDPEPSRSTAEPHE